MKFFFCQYVIQVDWGIELVSIDQGFGRLIRLEWDFC